jgi:hypothetical protein
MLRIAPAVPVGLPRVVPSSGATIAGVGIPAGVRVTFPKSTLIRPVDDNPTDGREPKSLVCPLFRTDLLPATRVPARTLATTGIEIAGVLVGHLLEGSSELSWHQVSPRMSFSVSFLSETAQPGILRAISRARASIPSL